MKFGDNFEKIRIPSTLVIVFLHGIIALCFTEIYYYYYTINPKGFLIPPSYLKARHEGDSAALAKKITFKILRTKEYNQSISKLGEEFAALSFVVNKLQTDEPVSPNHIYNTQEGVKISIPNNLSNLKYGDTLLFVNSRPVILKDRGSGSARGISLNQHISIGSLEAVRNQKVWTGKQMARAKANFRSLQADLKRLEHDLANIGSTPLIGKWDFLMLAGYIQISLSFSPINPASSDMSTLCLLHKLISLFLFGYVASILFGKKRE